MAFDTDWRLMFEVELDAGLVAGEASLYVDNVDGWLDVFSDVGGS